MDGMFGGIAGIVFPRHGGGIVALDEPHPRRFACLRRKNDFDHALSVVSKLPVFSGAE